MGLFDDLKKKAQAFVAQVNVGDGGRTYRTVMDKGAAYAPNQNSVAHQLTHNGLTNVVGSAVVKPAIRTGIAVNQGIANAELKIAGRPTLNAQQFVDRSFPATPKKVRMGIDYKGTKRQITGDLITTASNVAAPGSSKAIEAGIAGVAPKIVPKIVPKVVSNAAVGAPVGAVSNVGAYVASDEPITKEGVIKSAKQGAIVGAAGGAALPIAGAVANKAAQEALKKLRALPRAERQTAAAAASKGKAVQNIATKHLQPTDITGYGDLDPKRVEHYADLMRGGSRPKPLLAMRGHDGKLYVEDGKHRLAAMNKLGIKSARVKVITPDEVTRIRQGGYVAVPGRRGGASGSVAKNNTKPTTSGSGHKLVSTSNRRVASSDTTIAPEPPVAAPAVVPPQKPPVKAMTAPAGDMRIPPDGNIAVAAPGASRPTRYAAKTIPESQFVQPETGAKVKAAAPSYRSATEKKRYTAALSRVKNEGLDNVSNDVWNRLQSAENGKIDAQTVTEAQTVAQLLDGTGPEGTQRAVDIYTRLSDHLTAAGQTVQAAAIMARMSPEGLLLSAYRQLGNAGVKVTPELQAKLQTAVQTVKNTKPGSRERTYQVNTFRKVVQDNVPTEFVDKLTSFWKAGLLTGVKTSTGNILSNATFGVLHNVSAPLASFLDRGLSVITHQRTKVATPRGLLKGTVQGIKHGGKYLKTGVDELSDPNKYEQNGINFKNKAVNTYVNGVFRLMGAADKPFRYAQMVNSLYDMARADGLTKGLRGEALTQHVEDFVTNPPLEAAQRALNEGEKAVLGNDTALSRVVSWGRRGVENLPPGIGRTVLKLGINGLAPFTKVPSAFISRVVDFTPIGTLKEAGNQIARRQFDQRALVNAISEGTTGVGIIWLGYKLAQNRLITGSYPDDPKEQQRWKAEGVQPNSVKLGNTWASLNYLGPLGMLFNAGKRVSDQKDIGGGFWGQTGASVAGAPKDLMGQSFLQGLSGFTSAINDPQRSAKNYFNSQAASVVPSIVNDVGNVTDSKQRDTNTPWQGIEARIPGVRNTLPIKQDVYGNPLDQKSGPLNMAANPFRPSDAITNDVKTEVARLHNVDLNNKDLEVTPTPIDQAVTFDGVKTKLTDSQRYDLQNRIGQATQKAWGQLITTPEYASMSDADKANALNNLRQDATAGIMRSYAAENQLGQYSPSYTGKQTTLSLREQSVLNGTVNPMNYLPKGSDGGTNFAIAPGLDKQYGDTLVKYGSMSTANRDKAFSSDNGAEYQYNLARYMNDKANGSLSATEDIKRQASLQKDQVGTNFPKNIRELYTLSKQQLDTYLRSQPDGGDLASQVVAYDDALVAAGLSTKNKFRDGNGNVSITPSKKGVSSRNRKLSSASRLPVRKTVKMSIKMAKVKKLSTKKISTANKRISTKVRAKLV